MKSKIMVVMLFAASAVFAQVNVGIRIGAPPPMRVVVQPRSPGPGYSWVNGYWYPVGHQYKWHAGYYTRPAYQGAHWVEPHHDGQMYYAGHWDGDHGRIEHNHQWDKDKGHNRDYNHDHDR